MRFLVGDPTFAAETASDRQAWQRYRRLDPGPAGRNAGATSARLSSPSAASFPSTGTPTSGISRPTRTQVLRERWPSVQAGSGDGQLTVLLGRPHGAVRDPACTTMAPIVFPYRKGGCDTYHLYEIQADGSGLRQLPTATTTTSNLAGCLTGGWCSSRPAPAAGPVLADPGGHAPPLRRRRPQRP